MENIYFSVNPLSDLAEWGDYFKDNLEVKIDELRVRALNQEVYINEDIEVIKGISRYGYGFKKQDKFRIYIASNVSENYPIYVIVSAQYLHLNDVYTVIDDVQQTIREIFKYFIDGFEFEEYAIKLSRIDICNHNDKIHPDRYIRLHEFNSRTVTRIRKVFPVVELVGENDQKVPYFRYGKGDVAVRMYNKIQEVVEQRYKAFFILRWHELGLIDDKQKYIYDLTYRLNKSYYLDFMYAHFVYSIENNEGITRSEFDVITKIYEDNKLCNDKKYDLMNKKRKDLKIRLVKEVSNVEYQLRSSYLKTIKIVNENTGELIDYTDMFELFNHLDKLYEYLTQNTFRVVDRKSKAKRKRDKTTDPVWKEVQQSKIVNIHNFDTSALEVYRKYQKKMNKMDCVNNTVQKLAHLYYMNREEFDYEDCQDVNIELLLRDFIPEYLMNENFFDIRDKLERQIKYYGRKVKLE